MKAGDRPILMTQAAGKGRVTVFAGTVCGEPSEGELPFWSWKGWPNVMARLIADLAPKKSVSLPEAPADQAEVDKARSALDEIGDAGLEGLLDEDLEGDDVGMGGTMSSGTGKDLATFAGLTRNKAFAELMLKSVVGSNTRLTAEEAITIYDAITPYLTADTIGEAPEELIKSTAPGTIALGLRLGGLAGQKEIGPAMVKFLAGGLSAVESEGGDEGALPGVRMGVPDGKDEKLRLAAAQGLALLADPDQLKGARKALQTWDRERNRTPLLDNVQRDVLEMGWGALAAMGDGKAAVWCVERIVANSLDAEANVDYSEIKPMGNPDPPSVRAAKRKAGKDAILIRIRNDRLRDVLARLPVKAWKPVAAKVGEWKGEFAAETLLLTFADRGVASPAEAGTILKAIGTASPIPAVKRLCRRLGE
ncbi:MAG: hypothetical protein ACYTGH_14215 [Planctomycetota bacterium]|jgi:hypothetical protein